MDLATASTTSDEQTVAMQEAARPLLDFASQITTIPLLAVAETGAAVGSSTDPHGVCAVAASKASLERSPSGAWQCPVTACPHHSNFRSREVVWEGTALNLVHCEDINKLRAFSDLLGHSLTEHGDRSSLLDELSRVYEEINWFYGLGHLLQRDPDQKSIYKEIFAYAAEMLPVSAAEVWVPEPDGEIYRCLVSYDGSRLVKNRETVARTTHTDEGLDTVDDIRVLRESSLGRASGDSELLPFTATVGLPAIAVALRHEAQFLGLLLLRLDSAGRPLSAAQMKLLRVIGRQTGLCLQIHLLIDELRDNEGLKREVEIARQIQHGMLPAKTPRSERFELHAGCITAARVGGDYYDFFPRDESLGLLIADVSGHSVASGLIGMSFRSSFRHFLAMDLEMSDLMSRVNESLFEELHLSGHFLSAFHCTYSPATRRLRYVNAGHNPPFIFKGSTTEFVDLDEAGILIGVLQNSEYPVGEVEVEPGDIVVLYTDGIVEAENQFGKAFGVQRLKQSVHQNAQRSAKQMYHYLLKEMFLFQDEFFNKDDVTLTVLKIK